MITVEEAYRLIAGTVPGPVPETIPIAAVTGRILMEPVFAERDAPPFDRVMMDGFAIRYHEPLAQQFAITGIALAGHEPPVLESRTDCIEVTTGCPLPPGCDTVIPVEDCILEDKVMRPAASAAPRKQQYIHGRGSDGLAGRIVLDSGACIGPPELAILATEGKTDVKVARMPRIRLVTTGDEIVNDASKPGPAQIRGSHFEALRGLFHVFPGMGLERVHADDSDNDLRQKLGESLLDADILMITGGVSRGRKDRVPDLLKELGVEEVLHRVAQRPGKPLWFGVAGGKRVFGLPGNPISSLICARRYVFPVIEKWMGREPRRPMRIPVDGELEPLDGFSRFVPVKFIDSGMAADLYATSGSLHDLVGTDGFVEVPPAGVTQTTFSYFPWNSR